MSLNSSGDSTLQWTRCEDCCTGISCLMLLLMLLIIIIIIFKIIIIIITETKTVLVFVDQTSPQ